MFSVALEDEFVESVEFVGFRLPSAAGVSLTKTWSRWTSDPMRGLFTLSAFLLVLRLQISCNPNYLDELAAFSFFFLEAAEKINRVSKFGMFLLLTMLEY